MKINASRWPAYCLLLFAVLHLGFLLVHNSYALFKDRLAPLGPILNWPAVRMYARFTGGETAYGFFAPQIASQFYLQTDFLNKDGKLVSRQSSPSLQSREGMIRYATFLTKLQQLLPCRPSGPEACPDQRWIRAVITDMSRRQGQAIHADSACNRVYVLRHIPLGMHNRQLLPQLSLIYTQIIPIQPHIP